MRTAQDYKELMSVVIAAYIVNLLFSIPLAWAAQMACAEFWRPVSFWGAFGVIFVGTHIISTIRRG